MPKIYTKTGDKGETSLLGGKRVKKCCLEMEAIGEIDELNSLLGMLIEEIGEHFGKEAKKLLEVQKCLFIIGAQLAAVQMPKSSRRLTHLQTYTLTNLERWMDTMEKDLPRLKNFIIPGGCEEAVLSFYIRAVCRRAERAVVRLLSPVETSPRAPLLRGEGEEIKKYLNRLSDALFVLGRWLNKKSHTGERSWRKWTK